MIQTDLVQVDTYRIRNNYVIHRNQEWRSALEIIVDHEVFAFADDELINRLITEKWTRFGRWMYITRTVVPYTSLLCLVSIVAYLRGSEVQVEWSNILLSEDPIDKNIPVFCVWNLNSNYSAINTTNSSYPHYFHPFTDSHVCTLVLEYLLVMIGAPFLVWKGWRLRRRMHMRNTDIHDLHKSAEANAELKVYWPKNMQFFLDVLSSLLIVAAGVSRGVCSDTSELQLLSAACIILYCNFLYVLMPFKAIGSLVITMNTILLHDVLRFLSAYLIILLGFSWGLFLMFQRSEGFTSCSDDESSCVWSPKAEPLWIMLRLAWVSLGDNVGDMQDVYERTPNATLTLLTYILWVVLSTVLLLNLLIAMMSKTFDTHDGDTHRIWLFPFAALVLRYEDLFPEKTVVSQPYECSRLCILINNAS
jgi:hypothetical protein